MKFKTIITAAILFAPGFVSAATVNWANGGGRGHMFVAADGSTRIPAGSLVEVGFFAVANDALSVFTILGTTTLGDPGGGVFGGHLPAAGKSVVGNAANGNTTFAGKQFAVIVYNSAIKLNATQKGIFTTAAWTTPGGTGFDDSSDTVVFTVGTTASPGLSGISALDPDGAVGELQAGTAGVGPITIGVTTNNFGEIYRLANIVAVPEPSNILLMGLTATGLMIRRRRA